jgi:hypothetical protein
MRTKFANLLKPALLIGAVMCCFSCVYDEKTEEIPQDNKSDVSLMKIVVVDSCEYIQYHTWGYESVTHKGNCKYCAERMRRLIIK